MKPSSRPKPDDALEQTRGRAQSAQAAADIATRPAGARRGGDVPTYEDPFEGVPCASLTEVYRRYRPFVLWRIQLRLRRGTCPSLVEDIFQGVFVKLAQRVRAAHDVVPHPVKKLLDALASNEVRIQTRGQARRRCAGEPDDTMATGMPGPEQELSLVEERIAQERLVRAVFARMRPEASALVRMIDLEGLSYGEVAERVGCPVAAVKDRVHRARESFKEAFLELRRAAGTMSMRDPPLSSFPGRVSGTAA